MCVAGYCLNFRFNTTHFVDSDTAINDEDFESMSMDGMDISDLEGDAGTPRGPADIHQTKTPSPRHRQTTPSSGLSQYHSPSPPIDHPSKHPAQVQVGSVAGYVCYFVLPCLNII